MALSIPEARELFLQLWPPGRLYDWKNPASNISRFIDGCAETLKTFGYDVLDRLRREISPARIVDNIPDWEQALGLTSSYAALNGTLDQRRAGIIGKLREFGAFTLGNAQSILAPLLGYADPSKLLMLEVSRAAMRAAHTYTPTRVVKASQVVSSSTYVSDGGAVGSAGVQATVQFATAPTAAAPFNIELRYPDGSSTVWSTAQLGPPSTQYQLYDRGFVGASCNGTWTLSVSPAPGAQSLSSWSLFVEGVGLSGLGGDIVDWGAYADPMLMGSSGVPPDLRAAGTAIERIEHAHTQGYLILSTSAIPDLPTTLPDSTIPG